jgi:nucleotide-binding universal stress UspA family protein
MLIPPRLVLAAVDFSDSSRVALTFAGRLATHFASALHVLHAEDPLLETAARSHGIDLAAETQDELATFVKSSPPADRCNPVFHSIAGAPASVIRDVSTRVRADVIVVGMRGISAAEHLVFGSTTEAILRLAEVSVFAIPDEWTPPRPAAEDLAGIGPVVAAVEPTPSALQAAAAAVRLAAALGTSAEAIHVIPGIRVLNRWQGEANDLTSAREEAARRDLAEKLLSLGTGTPIPLHVESGNVAACVAAAIAETPTRHPMLVIGRRRKATGSTAYRILTLAKAPVLQCAV